MDTTYGGLRREGESATEAIRRLERTPGYSRVVATTDGQGLLTEAARERSAWIDRARRHVIPEGEARALHGDR